MLGIIDTITSRFSRRSLENPKIPLSDPAVSQYLDGSAESSSGAHVNRQTSLGLSAFWRGVNLISNTLAKVPTDVYKRTKDDGREVDDNHNAQWLLHNRPNELMTPFVFKKTCQAHVLTHGNSVSWLYAPGGGPVKEILPLDPDCVELEKRNGQYWYVWNADGKEERLARDEVLHIKGLSFNGVWGLSVIDILREVIGGGLALQKYGNVFFKNHAAPKVVIKLADGKRLKDQAAVERLRESWGRVHGGLENSHKPAILEDGTDVSAFNISNEDVQFLESKRFSLIDLANVFGLQPHKLGDATRTSYASLEQENQAFLDDTMDPWFVTWEQECGAKLLSEGEQIRGSRYVEFKRQALVRTNYAERTQAYHNLLQDGVVNRNEVRAWENLNPVPDGDKFYTPLNLAVDGKVIGEPEPEAAPKEEKPKKPTKQAASIPLDIVLRLQADKLNAEINRFWRRVSEHAKRASRKPQSFHQWLDVHLMADNREDFFNSVKPVIATITILTRGSTGDDTAPFVDQWFASVREQLNELTGQVTADQLENRVSAYFTETQPYSFGGNYAA